MYTTTGRARRVAERGERELAASDRLKLKVLYTSTSVRAYQTENSLHWPQVSYAVSFKSKMVQFYLSIGASLVCVTLTTGVCLPAEVDEANPMIKSSRKAATFPRHYQYNYLLGLNQGIRPRARRQVLYVRCTSDAPRRKSVAHMYREKGDNMTTVRFTDFS